ncbi:hypothetical protein CPC08DRAFT_635815 [Agrocybe pediades]|nr:hypothetical protein CPC08DRAFT_635815 [Agrocybe pediades]
MAETRTPRGLKQQLIFGGGTLVNQDSIEENIDSIDEGRAKLNGKNQWPSAYVDIFEDTVRIVLLNDSHLLSEKEINVLQSFRKLNYFSRYCLVRLVLRKPRQWHPVASLVNYEKEIGREGLQSAIETLCKPIDLIEKEASEAASRLRNEGNSIASPSTPIKKEQGPEIIDLTMDSDEEDATPLHAPTSAPAMPALLWSQEAKPPTIEERIQEVHDQSLDDVNFDFFCEDETVMSLHEILWRLSKEELMKLAKAMRCKVKGTAKKHDIISSLHSNAVTQRILNFQSTPTRTKGKAKADGMRQVQLPFAQSRTKQPCKKVNSQEIRLKQLALKALGKCVRVNYDFWLLVRRLHIICYRETELPTGLLLPALLTKFKKRDYTAYNHVRSKDMWESRKEFLEYEKALALNQLLEELLEATAQDTSSSSTKTPAPQKDHFATPAPPANTRQSTAQLITPGSAVSAPPSVKSEVGELDMVDIDEDALAADPVLTKEQRMKKQLDDWIFPKWLEYLDLEKERETAKGARVRAPGLERFQTGYIYARMVHKASASLVTLKDHERHLEVIESLLSQKYWRRGKRAAWYERRAIILGHLVKSAANAHEKDKLRFKTMTGIKEALLDEDTGTVFRPGLVKRLLKLEKSLKIPEEDRSICDGELRMAKSVNITAVRVDRLKLDTFGRPVNEKENGADLGLRAFIPIIPKEGELQAPVKRKMGKSVWKGKDGEHVNVETVALQYYEERGFTGFHCETKILTTIFGLLFWDIIFADVPGAFETPFQAAPLDIFEDTFYYARKELILKRLDEIKADKWREILERHDDAYRPKQTGCIGVSWDLCTKEDFLDIFECIGSQSLAMICQLFCEDYKGRSSGGPDLFVWKRKQGTCKFVEVKGPGDRPQENQKYWFDSLLRSEVDVEICWVKDEGNPRNQSVPGSSKKRKAGTPASSRKVKKNEEVDYEQLDLEPPEEVLASLECNTIVAKRQRTSKDEMPILKVEPAEPPANAQRLTTPSRPTINTSLNNSDRSRSRTLTS